MLSARSFGSTAPPRDFSICAATMTLVCASIICCVSPNSSATSTGGQYDNPLVIRPTIAADTHLSLQVVPYGEGQQLLLVRDVSRQVRLEAMRKDFVANASHELRSPLTVVSGYLET